MSIRCYDTGFSCWEHPINTDQPCPESEVRLWNTLFAHRVLFVAITSILVLSWVPYWLDIFAETYVGRIGRHMVYLNNCTNFLVFAMNSTLRQEMAQVIKCLICCRTGRAWVSVNEGFTLTPNITMYHSGRSCWINSVSDKNFNMFVHLPCYFKMESEGSKG